jgi:hypothetical protein
MGYIGTDGTYNAGTPKLSQMVPAPTSVWKASDHDRQRQDHKGELLRPYLPNGDANPEFVEQYPEESINTYKFIKSDEELAKEQ